MQLEGGDSSYKYYVVARGRIGYGSTFRDGTANYEQLRFGPDDDFQPINEFPLPFTVARQVLSGGGSVQQKQNRWREAATELVKTSRGMQKHVEEWTATPFKYQSRPVTDNMATCQWEIKLAEQRPKRPPSEDLKPDEVFQALKRLLRVYQAGNSLRAGWQTGGVPQAHKQLANEIFQHDSLNEIIRDDAMRDRIRAVAADDLAGGSAALAGGGRGRADLDGFFDAHCRAFEETLMTGVRAGNDGPGRIKK